YDPLPGPPGSHGHREAFAARPLGKRVHSRHDPSQNKQMRDPSSRRGETSVMRKQSRLFLYTRFVPASLLLAMGTGAAAQGSEDHDNMAMDVAAPAAIKRTVKWSDASAWPSGKVPAAGEEVTIPRGTEMMLD